MLSIEELSLYDSTNKHFQCDQNLLHVVPKNSKETNMVASNCTKYSNEFWKYLFVPKSFQGCVKHLAVKEFSRIFIEA